MYLCFPLTQLQRNGLLLQTIDMVDNLSGLLYCYMESVFYLFLVMEAIKVTHMNRQ